MPWTGNAKYSVTYVGGDGISFTCDILQKSYAGAATAFRVHGPAVQPIWQADNERLPWGALRGVCNVHIKGETTILDAIESADHDEYRLHFYDASNTYFYGSVITDFSSRSRNDRSGKEDGVIRAHDGLVLLEYEPWDDAGAAYTGRENIFQSVFVNGLNKLDYGLGFKVSVNWYPDSALLATDDPLSDNAAGSATEGVRHDREDFVRQILRSKGADPDDTEIQVYTWEVINYWLKALHCDLCNDGEYWHIYQRADKLATSRRVFTYDSAGATQTSALVDDSVTLDGTAAKIDDGTAQYRYFAYTKLGGDAYKGGTIRYRPSPLDLVDNRDLSDWSGGLPVGWTKSTSAVVTRSTIGQLNAIAIEVATPDTALYIDNGPLMGALSSDVEYVQYQTVGSQSINPAAGDGFQIKGVVRYRQAALALSTNPGFAVQNVVYWAHIQVQHLVDNYYLQADGTWDTTATKLKIEVPVIWADFRPVEFTFSGTFPDLTDGNIRVRLYQGTNRENNNSGGNIDRVGTIEWGPIELDYLPDDDAPAQERTTRVTVDGSDQRREYGPVTLYQSDGPDNGTGSRLTVESTDDDTGSWTKSGGAAGGVAFPKFWLNEFLKQFGTAPKLIQAVVQYWKGATGSKTAVPLRPWNTWIDGSFKGDLRRLEWDTALGHQKIRALELLQGAPTVTDNTKDERRPIDVVKPTDGSGDDFGGLPAGVALAWNWVHDAIDLLWDLDVTWTPKDRTRSVRYSLEDTDAEPVDWSVESISTKDASQESGTFTLTNIAHRITPYYLFVRAYTGTNGDGEAGSVVRVPLYPPVDPRYLGPTDCLNHAANEAIFSMFGVAGSAVLVNGITGISTSPNGSLEGTIGNWTWSDAGLQKTTSGTTEHVQLPNDLLGATTPNRLTGFNQLRRDTSSEIIVWRVTAGVQTVIECKILTTGIVRLAVTDETGATTNIDSTVTIGADEWAGVGHSIVPNGTYTTIYAYVLNKDNAEPIQKLAVVSENVALDFTDIKLFYSGELTIRLSHWLVQAWSKSMFNSEAICAREFTVDEGVDPGDVTNPQPAMVFRTDAGVEIYDLAGTQVEDWADATNVPGGITCRPAWHPGHSKAFYGADEDVVSADQDGANIAVEYSAAAGTKIRGLQYSPANGRLYLIKSDGAGTNSFGHLSGSPGAMSYNELSTAFDASDFFADGAHNVLVYEDLSDDDLYALILSTFVQLDTAAEANSAGVWYVRKDQEAYRMDTSANVFRQAVYTSPQFATTRFQTVDGSGFTSPRPNTLMIEPDSGLMFLVANDHVYVAPYNVSDFDPALTSSDFADIATLGDVCRGASLAMINVSPSLAAPVLSLGTETATTVPLTWVDIANETNYVLQQSTAGATGPFTTIDSPVQDATSKTVTGLTPETNYWYRIRGHNAAGAGPWSNVVAATTAAAPPDVWAVAVRSTTGTVHERLYLIDPATSLAITYHDITGAWGTFNDGKRIAYHSGIDRFLYGDDSGNVRMVEWTGSVWQNDELAYALGGSEPIRDIWVIPDGSVWVARLGRMARFDTADVHSGSTWGTPSPDYTGGGFLAAHAYHDGTDENVLMTRTGFAFEFYKDSNAPWSFAGFDISPGSPVGHGTWDKAASAVRYSNGATMVKAADTGGAGTAIGSLGAVTCHARVHSDGLLWYGLAEFIKSCDPDDGTGVTTRFDVTAGEIPGTSVNLISFEHVTLP